MERHFAQTLARRIALPLLLAVCAATALAAPAGAATSAGRVNVIRNANSSFDSFTATTDTGKQQWMRSHYWRMRGYAPYFNRALGWAPPADFYRDLYAIYNDETTLLNQHPNWVLKDGSGNRLYIPWACSGGRCTQYAADIGNPGFRDYWIKGAQSDLADGYKGIFIDDVNLEMKVGDGSGTFTRPIDPRTGQPMTDADWRRYMAEFTEEIRARIPGAYIVHNSLWWMGQADPYVRREVMAADAIELERGFNDTGLTGGTGKYGFQTLLSHVDWLHSLGKGIVLEPRLSTPAQRQFELASYYLVSNGADSICTDYETNPDNWWSGWETDLGPARGSRHEWQGLIRRDFDGGIALVNLPGASTVTVPLGGTYTDLDGNSVSSVTLGARQGIVLLGTPIESSPPPPITEEQPPVEEAPAIGSVEVTGVVKQTEESTAVNLDVQRWEDNHWSPKRTTRVRTKQDGRFKKRFRRLASGRYRVTASSAVPHRGRAILRRRHFVVR